MKSFLFWNNSHTLLRSAQGCPILIPQVPNADTTQQEILQFGANTILHVAKQSETPEKIYMYVTSPCDCHVYVKIMRSQFLSTSSASEPTRLIKYPSIMQAMTISVKACRTATILEGHEISNGCAICVSTSVTGPRAFGFSVTES